MRVLSSSEARLTAWTGAAGVVVGAVIATWLTAVVARGPAAPIDDATRSLAPDDRALRYRYALRPDRDASLDRAAAIAALEARIAAAPSPIDEAELAELLLQRAKQDDSAADFDAAEAAARRSLAQLPSPNAAVLTLARIAEARHDFRGAIALAQRHATRSSGAQLVIATAQLALGELAAADDAALAALSVRPSSAGHLMRALVLGAQGRDAEAALSFASAARAEEPGDRQAAAHLRALWGRFLVRRGELTAAKRAIEEALRVAPGLPLALAQRGELALRAGDPRDAARWFEQAFAGSRQVRYLIDQARALERSGEAASADALRGQVEALVRGELATGALGHRLDLVEVLVDRGQPAALHEAVSLAREELAQRASFEVRLQLARALARSGAHEPALRELSRALATGARDAQAYQLAARLESLRGNAGAASLYARAALRLDPSGAAAPGPGEVRR